ncbi:hypothetical protein B0H13DRAFT_2473922 [Mycena leptocephala]|nr:hypothetical protein B0H13DRAFT_2473922 [Mycena leptocephala]
MRATRCFTGVGTLCTVGRIRPHRCLLLRPLALLATHAAGFDARARRPHRTRACARSLRRFAARGVRSRSAPFVRAPFTHLSAFRFALRITSLSTLFAQYDTHISCAPRRFFLLVSVNPSDSVSWGSFRDHFRSVSKWVDLSCLRKARPCQCTPRTSYPAASRFIEVIHAPWPPEVAQNASSRFVEVVPGRLPFL